MLASFEKWSNFRYIYPTYIISIVCIFVGFDERLSECGCGAKGALHHGLSTCKKFYGRTRKSNYRRRRLSAAAATRLCPLRFQGLKRFSGGWAAKFYDVWFLARWATDALVSRRVLELFLIGVLVMFSYRCTLQLWEWGLSLHNLIDPQHPDRQFKI